MHRSGLEVDGLAPCKTNMANNTNVHCVGVIKDLKVKTLGIEVTMDIFVMPTKGGGLSYDLRKAVAYGHEDKTRLGNKSNQAPRT